MSPRTRHAPITSSPAACRSAQVARKSAQTNPAPTDKTARTNCAYARPNPPSAHSGNARANSQNCHVRPRPQLTPAPVHQRTVPPHAQARGVRHLSTATAVLMHRSEPEAGLVQPAPERPPALRIAREAGYGLRCTERTRTRPGHLAPQTARTKSEAAMDPQDLTQELRNEPERRRAHPFTAPQRQPPDDPALGGKPDQTPFSSTLSLRRACHGSARKP